MENKQNPFALHTVTPYLIVPGVREMVLFLEKVFGGNLRGKLNYREDNSVQHAEVKVGDSIIMMGEPMDGIEPTTSGMYVYVKNCDAVYAKAIDAGCISISEPMDYPHGDRYGGVKDFAGNIWWMVTHVGKN